MASILVPVLTLLLQLPPVEYSRQLVVGTDRTISTEIQENSLETANVRATMLSATGVDAPIGTQGMLACGGPNEMIFQYGYSYWALPYSWITTIGLTSSSLGDSEVIIGFTGAQGQAETVSFRLSKQMALTAASSLSARSGKPIVFPEGSAKPS